MSTKQSASNEKRGATRVSTQTKDDRLFLACLLKARALGRAAGDVLRDHGLVEHADLLDQLFASKATAEGRGAMTGLILEERLRAIRYKLMLIQAVAYHDGEGLSFGPDALQGAIFATSIEALDLLEPLREHMPGEWGNWIAPDPETANCSPAEQLPNTKHASYLKAAGAARRKTPKAAR